MAAATWGGRRGPVTNCNQKCNHPEITSSRRTHITSAPTRGDAPPKRGCELIRGPEPRTDRKQPNGPDEFVARGRSKLLTPEERTPPCQSFSSTSSPPLTATLRERAGPGSGASRVRSTSRGSASSPRSPTLWGGTPRTVCEDS